MLAVILCSLLIGAILALVAQALLLRKWFFSLPVTGPQRRPQSDRFSLPKVGSKTARHETSACKQVCGSGKACVWGGAGFQKMTSNKDAKTKTKRKEKTREMATKARVLRTHRRCALQGGRGWVKSQRGGNILTCDLTGDDGGDKQGGRGKTKGLVTLETPYAGIQLGTFFKGSEVMTETRRKSLVFETDDCMRKPGLKMSTCSTDATKQGNHGKKTERRGFFSLCRKFKILFWILKRRRWKKRVCASIWSSNFSSMS